MSRHIKSPTRTISNRGPLRRFIGYFPCRKNDAPWIAFDSISSLSVAIYLEWIPEVVSVSFEHEKLVFGKVGESRTVIPDYTITLDSGEVRYIEAKSRRDMNQKETDDILLKEQIFSDAGKGYAVIYRRELETNGCLETIFFLRRYSQLRFPAKAIDKALRSLVALEPLTLARYRRVAQSAHIPFGLLYHILYKKLIPLRFEPFTHEEMDLCPA